MSCDSCMYYYKAHLLSVFRASGWLQNVICPSARRQRSSRIGQPINCLFPDLHIISQSLIKDYIAKSYGGMGNSKCAVAVDSSHYWTE